MTLDISDMLGKPYVVRATGPDAYDCWGVVAEVARRMGFGDVEPDPESWNRIGVSPAAARKPGDVIMTESGGLTGVAILLPDAPRMLATAMPSRGVCLVPVRSLADSAVAVYRPRKVQS